MGMLILSQKWTKVRAVMLCLTRYYY